MVGLLWAQLPCGSRERLINIFLILQALARGRPPAQRVNGGECMAASGWQ